GQPILWLVALAGLGAVLAAVQLVHERVRNELAAQASSDKPTPIPVQYGIVKLGVKEAERSGLKYDLPAQAISWKERQAVYGQVVPNPRATVEVRTAFAGTLRTAPDVPWPMLGERLAEGRVLGQLDVRFGPQDRLDWQAKLEEATARKEG